jgi:hypothetical protein
MVYVEAPSAELNPDAATIAAKPVPLLLPPCLVFTFYLLCDCFFFLATTLDFCFRFPRFCFFAAVWLCSTPRVLMRSRLIID